ncbi:hypothetical protein EI94DRAFT_718670 [Lactarius quietus]|nr:hypothetical protein EI94DRAFT_718670 [Lactarius quietus]
MGQDSPTPSLNWHADLVLVLLRHHPDYFIFWNPKAGCLVEENFFFVMWRCDWGQKTGLSIMGPGGPTPDEGRGHRSELRIELCDDASRRLRSGGREFLVVQRCRRSFEWGSAYPPAPSCFESRDRVSRRAALRPATVLAMDSCAKVFARTDPCLRNTSLRIMNDARVLDVSRTAGSVLTVRIGRWMSH